MDPIDLGNMDADQVANFVLITGATDQEAIGYLESTGHELQAAVELFFAVGGGGQGIISSYLVNNSVRILSRRSAALFDCLNATPHYLRPTRLALNSFQPISR